MALKAIGKNYNPGTLNAWLRANNGYYFLNWFKWWSVAPLGLIYIGKINKYRIGINLDVNNVVIIKVQGGRHWVIATFVSGSRVYVNDPAYNKRYYSMSEI